MIIKQINPKTGKKEEKIQCPACCKWVFMSEYSEHYKNCKDAQENIGIMFI